MKKGSELASVMISTIIIVVFLVIMLFHFGKKPNMIYHYFKYKNKCYKQGFDVNKASKWVTTEQCSCSEMEGN